MMLLMFTFTFSLDSLTTYITRVSQHVHGVSAASLRDDMAEVTMLCLGDETSFSVKTITNFTFCLNKIKLKQAQLKGLVKNKQYKTFKGAGRETVLRIFQPSHFIVYLL